jgi:beta-lactamase regulating signal transducer with metallopeptidase domain
MNGSGLPITAQLILARTLNALPEGLLLVLFAWFLLRILKRQNSGTRFAIWFLTLVAVVALPFLNTLQAYGKPMAVLHASLPQITLSTFEASLIFAIWALVSGIAIIRLAIGLRQVLHIRRSCENVDPTHLDPEIQKIMQQSGSVRKVCLAISKQVRVPVAIGFYKPAIVIPSWMMQELSTQELAVILVHEHTHLRRMDDWTNLFQKIVRAVFFFHPAVWWIDARLSLEREMACDDAVLAVTDDPRAYASCLIEMLEKSCERRGWAMAQAAVQRAKELSLRLAQILDEKRPVTTQIWKPALTIAGAFSLVGLLITPYGPQLVSFDPPTSLAAMHVENLPRIHRLAKQEPETALGASIVPASFTMPTPSRTLKQSLKPKATTTEQHDSASPLPHIATYTKRKTPQMIAVKAIEPSEAPAQMMLMVETTFEFSQSDARQTVAGNKLHKVNANETCVTGVSANGWRMQVCDVVVIGPVQTALADDILQDAI